VQESGPERVGVKQALVREIDAHADRWLTDFAELPIKVEVRPLILKDNAIRALGLR
jgi:hypothetical protein